MGLELTFCLLAIYRKLLPIISETVGKRKYFEKVIRKRFSSILSIRLVPTKQYSLVSVYICFQESYYRFASIGKQVEWKLDIV